MKDQNEIWRKIPSYERNYQISNLGKVRRFNLVFKTYKILNLSLNGSGFLYVSLLKDKKTKRFLIHELIAYVFAGADHVTGDKFVIHVNYIKTDNRSKNIEVVGKEKHLQWTKNNDN